MYYNERVTFGLKRNIANGLIWLFSPLSAIIFFFGVGSDEKIKHKAMQSILVGVFMLVLARSSGLFNYLPLVGNMLGFLALEIVKALKLSMFALSVLEFCQVDINVPVVSKIAVKLIK